MIVCIYFIFKLKTLRIDKMDIGKLDGETMAPALIDILYNGATRRKNISR